MPRINPTLPSDGDDAIVEPYNAAITAILGVLNGAVDSDNLAAGAVTLANLASAVQGALVPTGMIAPFGGSAAPTGWLLCDGTSYLRSAYSSLFAVVGSSFGSADGTHFNVPDLQGRVPVGREAMSGSTTNRIERSSTLTTTSGSANATVGSATGLAVGMTIKNANVPAGTTISSLSGTTVTMSANATANGTTIATRFSLYGADAQVVGSVGGSDIHTLNSLEIPPTQISILQGVNFNGAGLARGDGTYGTVQDSRAAIAGGGLAHAIVQPGVLVSYIIKT